MFVFQRDYLQISPDLADYSPDVIIFEPGKPPGAA